MFLGWWNDVYRKRSNDVPAMTRNNVVSPDTNTKRYKGGIFAPPLQIGI